MKNRKILMLMISLVCLLVVGIGFATVNISLNVSGTIVTPASIFDVGFIDGTGYTVSKTNVDGDTVIITNLMLSSVGHEETISIGIQNKSTDFYAEIPMSSFVSELTSSTSESTEDVEVRFDCAGVKDDKITLAPSGKTNITVSVKLLKVQMENEKFKLRISFDASSAD